MDLFSALVPIEVIAPVDRWGEVLAELNRAGGVIFHVDSFGPCRVSARIPAADLKKIELWVAKAFGDQGRVELLPVGGAERNSDAKTTQESLTWLHQLKSRGSERGFLTHAQVNEMLPLEIVDPNEIEKVVEQLKSSGIRVVPDPLIDES